MPTASTRYFLLLALLAATFWLPQSVRAHEGERGFQFIENKGQWPDEVRFRTDVPSGALFLEERSLTYRFYDAGVLAQLHGKNYEGDLDQLKMRYHVLRVKFDGANPTVPVKGALPHSEYFNYFLGNDKSKWASHARVFEEIHYPELYPGTNLLLYTEHGQLKYDFKLKPGADPNAIRMRYEGAEKLQLKNGKLIVRTSLTEMEEQTPYAYQYVDGEKVEVPCEFRLKNNVVSFVFPDGYNANELLVIDPVLLFSTFSGSTANNFGYTASFDRLGFLYTGSTAFGVGYDTTAGAFSTTFAGGNVDIALTKFDTTGSTLIWSTYLGGNEDELPHSLVVNDQDELYMMGTTSSSNWPTINDSYDTIYGGGSPVNLLNGLGVNFANGSDIVVVKLNDDGSALLGSTYLGGAEVDGLNIDPNLRYNYADEVRGEVLLNANNEVLIASSTQSTDFPSIGAPFQPTFGGGSQDGTITKLNADLTQVIWSSFLGGDQGDAVYAIALDNQGNTYISGGTYSFNLNASSNVLFPNFSGGRSDGFIAHIANGGQSLIAMTYFGTPFYEQLFFIETDRENNVYVFGQTESQDSTFFFNAGYGQPGRGQVVSKMNASLDTLTWSTTFGSGIGTPNISPTAFLVDVCKSVYLSGWGGNVNQLNFLNNNAGFVLGMDTTVDAFQGSPGDASGSDFYLMVLSDDANNLIYASFFGGTPDEHVDGGTSRFDRKGRIYQSVCAGCGGSSSFPLTSNPYSATNGSLCNNAVFKMDFNLPIVVADFVIPPEACRNYTVNFQNNSVEQNNTTWFWDFGDNTTSTVKNPTHTYTQVGTYTVMLAMFDFASCNATDTIFQTVTVSEDTTYTLGTVNICPGDSIQIGISPEPGHFYQWTHPGTLSDENAANPLASPSFNNTYTMIDDDGVCVDTITQTVQVLPGQAFAGNDTLICSTSGAVTLTGQSGGIGQNFIWSSNDDFTDTLNAPITDSLVTVSPSAVMTTYYLKTITDQGCETVDSVVVTISDFATEVVSEVQICAGDSVQLTVTNLAPNNPLTYAWQPNQFIHGDLSSATVGANPPATTQYVVNTTDSIGCQSSDTILVTVSTLQGINVIATSDDDTILLGESTVLRAQPGGFSYTWSPGGSLNNPNSTDPIATPDSTTTYLLTVEDPNVPGCVFFREVTVVVQDFTCGDPDVFVPNAFTPDEDGTNDVLFVRGNNVEEMFFAIYNRWGEKVFESEDQSVGWNGTFNGKEVDPAVYAYYLKVTCPGGQTYFEEGNITVIR